jgi:hypothetical protein
MDKFYYFDGQGVVGAHNLQEMQEMFAMATINTQTPVIRPGEKDWQTLGAYCDLNAPECQPLELDFYIAPTLSGTQAMAAEALTEHQANGLAPDQPDVSIVATMA